MQNPCTNSPLIKYSYFKLDHVNVLWICTMSDKSYEIKPRSFSFDVYLMYISCIIACHTGQTAFNIYIGGMCLQLSQNKKLGVCK